MNTIVMATLGCQLDIIRMNYNPEMEDTLVTQILRQEDSMSLIGTEVRRDTFNLGYTFYWKPL